MPQPLPRSAASRLDTAVPVAGIPVRSPGRLPNPRQALFIAFRKLPGERSFRHFVGANGARRIAALPHLRMGTSSSLLARLVRCSPGTRPLERTQAWAIRGRGRRGVFRARRYFNKGFRYRSTVFATSAFPSAVGCRPSRCINSRCVATPSSRNGIRVTLYFAPSSW